MLSQSDGRFLLRLCRETIEKFTRGQKLSPPTSYPPSLETKAGVFCTIHKLINKRKILRGCIGIPYPIMPLIKAAQTAAISACEDPRFPKLDESELKDIKIEISILTPPELIEVSDPEDYPKKIKPKVDGLILQRGSQSGLFLPQVWEELPKKTEFLDHLCLKAGLPPGCWTEPGVKIYKFQVQIFEEE
jgi:AmmeMemoRadiSam system protein A